MDVFFFYYDVVVILACAFTASVCACSYFVSRRRSYLAAAAFFCVYVAESCVIFMDEYLRIKPAIADDGIIVMTHPWAKWALSVLFVSAAWAFVLLLLEQMSPRRMAAPIAAVAALKAAALLFIADENTRQLVFWAIRDLAVLFMLGYLSLSTLTLEDEGQRRYLWGYRTVMLVCLVLELGVLFEDVSRLAFGAGMDPGDELMYYLTERNIFENTLVFVLAGTLVYVGARTLSLRFKEPPVATSSRVQQAVELRFDHFCTASGLTARERDVLNELLAGKDNQNIASELVISVGTVKAHVHSIYKKCGVASRQELLQVFWRD